MTRQRGPNSAHHTHKQKKAQLQEARRRARDREATDEAEDAYEAALVSAANRVPKVVQARLYTYREHRGGVVLVRLRLAIDRQQCAGFVPGLPAGALPPPPPVSSSPQPLNADERRARDWARRGKALRTALSETTRLKSLTEVERQWMASVSACAQLIEEVRAEFTIGTVAPGAAGASTSYGPHPWLFGLVQQALQTGPLAFGKPAQLKRMAKGLESKRGKTLEVGLHPHARAVRVLLLAVGTLARALEAQQLAAAAGATGGGGGGAGTVEDVASNDDDDAARAPVVEGGEEKEEDEEEAAEAEAEAEVEAGAEVEAEVEAEDGASGAAVSVARAVEDNTPSVTLSSRQREIVAAWIAEFGQAFGVGVDGEPVPSAPDRSERSRRGACAVLGETEVGGIRFGAVPLLGREV